MLKQLAMAAAMLTGAAAAAHAPPAAGTSSSDPIQVVAAENFYGDIVSQIGGDRLQVLSILNNPEQDPHLFEATPSIARALSKARLVVYNGADYDPWMQKLLSAAPNGQREIIVASDLLDPQPSSNPHIWYRPDTLPAVANAVTAALARLDPEGATLYRDNLKRVQTQFDALHAHIAAMRDRYAGTPVTATEPVFGHMADALGLDMRNQSFQLAIMNGTEPSMTQIRALEDDLTTGKVRLLFYNNQEEDSFTQRVRRIAQEHGIPVVGVTETMPQGQHVQSWMESELAEIERQLGGQ